MIFVPSPSTAPIVEHIVDAITVRLAIGQVLWLVSGGSCIAVAVNVASRLNKSSVDLKNLTISLIDERYGTVGHADSNWTQLLEAGFDLPGANLVPVLAGASMQNTATNYAKFLEAQFTSSYSIGLIGIGPDGHISGIKPDSPAVAAEGLVSAYDWDDYQRITTTPAALHRLDEAMVYAAGEAKWPVLESLSDDVSPDEQPAQFLKTMDNVTIFSDRPLD